MLFKLIKNEYIKFYKKPKTVGLIILLVLGAMGLTGLGYIETQRNIKWNSVEYQIENEQNHLKYLSDREKEIQEELANKEISKNDKKYIKEELNDLEMQTKDATERLKILEERKSKNLTWQETLKIEIESLKKDLESTDDARYKDTIKKEIQEKEMAIKDNVKPIEDWEFMPGNLLLMWSMIIGMGIPVYIALLGSDIVSDESTNETFKFLLIQPVSRGKILLSKFIALVTSAIGLLMGIQGIAFLAIGLVKGFKDLTMPATIGIKYKLTQDAMLKGYFDIEPIANSGYLTTRGNLLGQSMILQFLFIIACCAVVFMISTLCKNNMMSIAFSTIILGGGMLAPLMLGASVGNLAHLSFLSYGFSSATIQGEIAALMGNLNMSPSLGVIVIIVTTIVSYFIAHTVFKRKDILV